MARVPTDGGGHWLKACSAATAHEITVLEVLARETPDAVLVPLGSDPVRGLVLLPDGGPLLGESRARDRPAPSPPPPRAAPRWSSRATTPTIRRGRSGWRGP